MRYAILDCDGVLIGKAGSIAKAEQIATAYEKQHGYLQLDPTERRYCIIQPIK